MPLFFYGIMAFKQPHKPNFTYFCPEILKFQKH